MGTYLLVDGNSLTYRAFFALPTDMATASGQVTNAVFGFTSMLINLLQDHRPDNLAVAFDLPEPTFRHTTFDGYKAGRQETPDILRQQLGLVSLAFCIIAFFLRFLLGVQCSIFVGQSLLLGLLSPVQGLILCPTLPKRCRQSKNRRQHDRRCRPKGQPIPLKRAV